MSNLGLGDAVVALPSEENIHNDIDGEFGVITGGEIVDGRQMFNVALVGGRTVPIAADAVKLRIRIRSKQQAQD